jgi:lipopolysaccharide transport system permease protein
MEVGSRVRADGAKVIIANRGLITQVYFHKGLFVAKSLTASCIKFAIVLALLLTCLLITATPFGYTLLALVPIIFVQLALIAGMTAVAASIVPFVPEFKLIIDNGLIILFFMSGIFFDVNQLPQNIFYLNPMVTIIGAYRDVLLNGGWPDARGLGVVAAVGALLLYYGTRRQTDPLRPTVP